MFNWLEIAIDYIGLMRYLVIGLSFILAIYAFHKAINEKDIMQWIVGLSRVFIGAMYICIVINPNLPPEFRVVITTGFVLLFIADGSVVVTDRLTKKFKVEKELNQMKMALARLSDKTHFILDSCPVGIFQYSCATLQFVYVNKEFAGYFGKDPSWFIGKSVLDGIVPEARLKLQQSVKERLAVEDKGVLVREMPIILPPPSYKNATLRTESKLVFNGESTILGYATLVQ